MFRGFPKGSGGEAAASSSEAHHNPHLDAEAPANPRNSLYDLYCQNSRYLNATVEDCDEATEPDEYHYQTCVKEDESCIEQNIAEAMNVPLDSGNASNTTNSNFSTASSETVIPGTPMSTASTTSTEPFPDYYESCEANAPVVDRGQEEAYNYAISKVVEEVIRFRDVDESITSLGSYLPRPIDPNNPNEVSTILQTFHPRRQLHQTSAKSAAEFNAVEDFKSGIRDQMDTICRKSNVKACIRMRFSQLSNHIMDMEYIMFRRHNFHPSPLQVLTAVDLIRVRFLATEVIKYLSFLGGIIHEEWKNAQRVRYIIASIADESNVSPLVRFKRMSQVFLHNLRKPRSLEQHLLNLFFELYNVFFYADFLNLYEQYTLRARVVIPELADVFRISTTIAEILRHAIRDYEAAAQINRDIGTRWIEPAIEQLSEGPSIWNECVAKHHLMTMAADDAKPAVSCQSSRG